MTDVVTNRVRLPGLVRSWPRPRQRTGWVTALLIAVLVVFALTTHRFLTWGNIKAILNSASMVGIMALGLTFVTMVGSVVSLAVAEVAVIGAMAFLATLGLGLFPALLIAMALGAGVAALQGVVIGAWGANPVVLTIAAAFVIDGIAQGIHSGAIVQPATGAYGSLNSTPLGIPVAVYVMVGLALALQYLARGTVLGRQIILVGANRAAARAAGLPVTRVITLAFALSGAAFGLGGAFLGAYNTGASTLMEGTVTFNAIAAVLVGGTSITGGHGSPLRTLWGALAIAAITDLLLLRGLGSGPQVLVEGVLVLFVVIATQARSRTRES
jgi:simple sugar transport system permease protein/ribose transport system permease protein